MNFTVSVTNSAGALATATVLVEQTAGVVWPSAANTGVPAGTTLTNSGSITTTSHGQVINARNIAGTVTVNHNNVTVQNCKIKSGAFSLVRLTPGRTGFTIKDCELDCNGAAGSCAVNGSGTILRCNMHDMENGYNFDGAGPTLIEGNFIHSLRASGSPHYDGIQIDGSATAGVIIRGNRIHVAYNQTAAVMIDNYFGPINNILVEANWLSGGGYTVYCDGQFNSNPITNVRFINNKMGRGSAGYNNFNRTNPVWTGNYDAVTGNPI